MITKVTNQIPNMHGEKIGTILVKTCILYINETK